MKKNILIVLICFIFSIFAPVYSSFSEDQATKEKIEARKKARHEESLRLKQKRQQERKRIVDMKKNLEQKRKDAEKKNKDRRSGNKSRRGSSTRSR